MPFPSDKSRKKHFAEKNSYRTNAWNNSEKLKEDIMNESLKSLSPKDALLAKEFKHFDNPKIYEAVVANMKKNQLKKDQDKNDIMNDAKRDGLPKGYKDDDGI